MTSETSCMQLTDYMYLLCVLGFDFSKYEGYSSEEVPFTSYCK